MLNPFISSRPFTLSDVKFIDTRFYVFNKLFYINNFLTLYDEYEPFLSIEDLFKLKIPITFTKNITLYESTISLCSSRGQNR